MEKYNGEEELKLHYTTLNYKMEMKTTLNSVLLQFGNPRGVFIATREEGGQLETAGQNLKCRQAHMAAKSRPWPHFRGHVMAVRAVLRAARCPVSSDARFLVFRPWFCRISSSRSMAIHVGF